MLQVLPDLTADEVRAFRTGLGLSQAKFAERFGFRRRSVEDWETKGAPGYWRYVLAAIDAGLRPYGKETLITAFLLYEGLATPAKEVRVRGEFENASDAIRLALQAVQKSMAFANAFEIQNEDGGLICRYIKNVDVWMEEA